MRIKLWLFVFGVVLGSFACRPPPGAPDQPSKNLSCVTEAVQRNWHAAYPHVMSCLTGIMDSPLACLDAVPSVAAVTMDTVACIVRGAAREAGMQAEKYGGHDVVTVRKAERANAWLESRGYTFE